MIASEGPSHEAPTFELMVAYLAVSSSLNSFF